MADDELGALGLGALGERNEFLKTQIEGMNRAARGTGGAGTNQFDEDARELSEQQIAVEEEITDRLFGIHQERSLHAQETDEQRKAPVPESPETWAGAPSEWDWPLVDLPRE